jgi:uncharacterized protein YgiM (DUF1202 family)
MKNKLVCLLSMTFLGLGLVGLPKPAHAAICIVTDPTDTELNIRSSPNGRVIGTLPNGAAVQVVGSANNRGRRWAKIRARNGATAWVLREYVTCR